MGHFMIKKSLANSSREGILSLCSGGTPLEFCVHVAINELKIYRMTDLETAFSSHLGRQGVHTCLKQPIKGAALSRDF